MLSNDSYNVLEHATTIALEAEFELRYAEQHLPEFDALTLRQAVEEGWERALRDSFITRGDLQ